MKKLLTIIVLFFGLNVFGSTPQIPDKLIYNGKEYLWNGYSPAFDYFDKNNLKPPEEALETTANYGIFFFTYTVDDGHLYLTDVEILVETLVKDGSEFIDQLADKSIFKDYFPDTNRVLMQEHSNIQVIPYGEIIETTKNNRVTTHTTDYLVFEIKNGIVTTEFDLDYKQFNKFKTKQFKNFKQTRDYQKATERERENFDRFNEYNPDKFTMDEYLEFVILRLINNLS